MKSYTLSLLVDEVNREDVRVRFVRPPSEKMTRGVTRTGGGSRLANLLDLFARRAVYRVASFDNHPSESEIICSIRSTLSTCFDSDLEGGMFGKMSFPQKIRRITDRIGKQTKPYS